MAEQHCLPMVAPGYVRVPGKPHIRIGTGWHSFYVTWDVESDLTTLAQQWALDRMRAGYAALSGGEKA